MSGSGISWAVCKSAPCCRQMTMPAPHHSVFFRPDALPVAQPTASKHWRQKYKIYKVQQNCFCFWLGFWGVHFGATWRIGWIDLFSISDAAYRYHYCSILLSLPLSSSYWLVYGWLVSCKFSIILATRPVFTFPTLSEWVSEWVSVS